MKERGMIIGSDKVRAFLNGATQHRVPMKPQPTRSSTFASGFGQRWLWRGHISEDYKGAEHMFDPFLPYSPFGVPGDVLWVRETILQTLESHGMPSGEPETCWTREKVEYVADGAEPRHLRPDHCHTPYMAKRPSIHMPRWASRILLNVKRVWVERVDDISTNDAIAEGIELPTSCGNRTECLSESWPGIGAVDDALSQAAGGKPWAECYCARDIFHELWDSINAKRGFGWDSNPWVWCVEFERIPAEFEKVTS